MRRFDIETVSLVEHRHPRLTGRGRLYLKDVAVKATQCIDVGTADDHDERTIHVGFGGVPAGFRWNARQVQHLARRTDHLHRADRRIRSERPWRADASKWRSRFA